MPKANGQPTKREQREHIEQIKRARQAGYCVRTVLDEDAFAADPASGNEVRITFNPKLTQMVLDGSRANGYRAYILVNEQG